MHGFNKPKPTLPSNFVTLADLKERWLKQKELERKENELQEQRRRQQEEAKQIQQHHEVHQPQCHRGGSENRPNRNKFKSQREFRGVGSFTSGGGKKKRSEVGNGVGLELSGEKKVEEEERHKKAKFPRRRKRHKSSPGSVGEEAVNEGTEQDPSEKSKEIKEKEEESSQVGVGVGSASVEQKKTDKKTQSGRRWKQSRSSPKLMEKEVVSEGTENASMEKKREMKEEEENIVAGGRTRDGGITSGFKLGESKKFLKEVERNFGKFCINDARSGRFTRQCDWFPHSFKGNGETRSIGKILNKQMVWVRKDRISCASPVTGNAAAHNS